MLNKSQEARLSQWNRAMLHVTEYFAKSLKVIKNDTLSRVPFQGTKFKNVLGGEMQTEHVT